MPELHQISVPQNQPYNLRKELKDNKMVPAGNHTSDWTGEDFQLL